MHAETPEQKFNRLRDHIQNLYLTAHPNPDRVGCPGGRTLENLAKRASDFQDNLEADPDYQHVLRCSPCYRDFLDATEELRKLRTTDPDPVPRQTRKRLSRTLDKLEAVMKSAAREARRRRI